MKIICCYTRLDPRVAAMLAAHAPDAELVDLSYDPHLGYWQEIAKRWTGEEDLMIVEHDVLIHGGTVESFQSCREPWCLYGYRIFRTQVRCTMGLGCVRFTAECQQQTSPAEIAEAFSTCPTCHGAGCWYHLDSRIAEVLLSVGLKPHDHGDVYHLHDYSRDEFGEPLPPEGKAVEWWSEDTRNDPPGELIDWGEGDPGPWHPGFAVTGRQAFALAEELLELAARYGRPMPPSTLELIA